MSRRNFVAAAIALTTLMANLIPGSALACGFCLSISGNPLALPHPKAIEIAVATRAALERGHLKTKLRVPAELLQSEGAGWTALERIPPSQLVQVWAAKLGVAGKEWDGLSVHFLFIDAEHSCGLNVRKGMVLYEANTGSHCDARVITTRAVFRALVTGEMAVARAQHLGVLVLEGDNRVAHFLARTLTKVPGG